jgi:alkyl hydroperoxide reductase subunit F
MYDLIIIGSGPAGMTAAIYASRREMKTLVIGKELGGQVVWASEIENYPGFKSISNYELISKMSEQVKSLGVEIQTNEVQKIEKNEDGTFTLFTSKEQLQTKTVLIAMGLSPRRLAIPGEQEFSGKGVTYCANCDGPFYKGKTVAVIGGGNAALDAAEVMSKIANQVYLVHRNENFKAFDVLVNEVKSKPNIKMVLNTDIKEILGTSKVEKIKVLNSQTQEEKEIAVDGVFVEVGRIASTDLIAEFAERDERNQVLVDEKFMTKTPGLFAAGDVVHGEFKQITIACGQATVAALAAYQFLQLKSGKNATVILDRSH